MMKVSSRTGGRSGSASGTLSVSHTEYDGFRQHSSSHFTQLNLGADYIFGSSTTGTLRFGYSDAPQAENPGALTQTEYLANPDSAAAGNLLRDADKDVSQGQLGLSLKHYGERSEWTATVFGLLRDLANPLATPPPSGPGPDVGTNVNIDRSRDVNIQRNTAVRGGHGYRGAPYAHGALRAARWVQGRSGWYSMRDVLGITENAER